MSTRLPFKYNSIHLHIYGSPGVGKSTLAAAVFSELKIRRMDCELVMEYAKELLREGKLDPREQALTTAEQIRREKILVGDVQIIVTDSPPLLGVAYALPHDKEPLRQSILSITRSWRTLAIFLERDLMKGYEQNGREQTPEQSLQKSAEIVQILNCSKVQSAPIRMSDDPRQIRDVADQLCDQLQMIVGVRPGLNEDIIRKPLREIRVPPLDFATNFT